MPRLRIVDQMANSIKKKKKTERVLSQLKKQNPDAHIVHW